MVFRVHKTDNYTVMSNHHLQNENLSLKAKGLMSIMLSLPPDWDYSAKGLTTLSRDGEDTVKSALKELEEQGYLKRTQIRVKGVITDWQYDIYENPQTVENIESEPEGEKPQVVKPLVENPLQINTNKQNTKEEINKPKGLGQATPARRHLITCDTSKPAKTPKKNLYDKCIDEIDSYTEDADIRNRLKEYLPVRLSRKDIPMNLPSFRGMLKKLDRVAGTKEDKLASIQQSIDRQYPTFYEPHKKRVGQDKSVFSEYGKVKSEHKKDEVIMNVQF